MKGLEKSCLDFAIHGALFDPANQVEEIPKAFNLGVTSFKMFMTYAKLKWMTDDYWLAAAMDLIGANGGLAMVHAENGLVTDYFEDRSLKKREDPKKVFVKTRPDYLEAEAIFRAIIDIAAVTRLPSLCCSFEHGQRGRPCSAGKGRGPSGLCRIMPAVSYIDGSRPSEERTPG